MVAAKRVSIATVLGLLFGSCPGFRPGTGLLRRFPGLGL